MSLATIPDPFSNWGRFASPSNLPGVSSLLGYGTEGNAPIFQNLPQQQDQFAKKYGSSTLSVNLNGTTQEVPFSQYPQDVLDAMVAYDRTRVSKGSPPLNNTETYNLLQTAMTGKAATPPPARDPNPLHFISNALHDLTSIGLAIPRLPMALWHEIQNLPNFAKEYAANEKAGMNPIAALARAPGVRLIPGAYTVGNLASGVSGIREELSHPLMSFLDVLPATSKLAEGTRVAELAQEARLAANPAARARPLKAVIMNKVVPDLATGEDVLARSRLGARTDQFMKRTKVGQALSSTFAPVSRDLSRLENLKTFETTSNYKLATDLRNRGIGSVEKILADPESYTPQEVIAAHIGKFTFDHEDWTAPEKEQFYNAVTQADTSQLPGHLLAAVPEVRNIVSMTGSELLRQQVLSQFGDELYTAKIGNRLNKATARLAQQTDTAALRNELNSPTQPAIDYLTQARDKALSLNKVDASVQVRALLLTADKAGLEVAPLLADEALARGGRITWPEFSRRADAYINSNPVESPQAFATKADQLLAARYLSTDRRVGTLTRQLERMKTKYAPARFQSLIEQGINTALKDEYILPTHTPEQTAAITDAILNYRYDQVPGYSKKFFDEVTRDVTRTWQEMKAQGLDPVFMHRVAPGQAAALTQMKIGEVPRALTQVRERIADISPTAVKDVVASMTHASFELLGRMRSEEFITTFIGQHGFLANKLRDEVAEEAYRLWEKDPRLSRTAWEEKLIKEEFVPFDPAKYGYSWHSEKLNVFNDNQYYIRKSLANNLLRMHNPAASPLTALLEGPTKLFRVSVVGMSPRVQLQNIVGGLPFLMADTDPAIVLRNLNTARVFLGKDPQAIADLVQSLPTEVQAMLSGNANFFADLNFKAGKSLARVADETRAGQVIKEQGGKVTGALAKLSERSLEFNLRFDNMYRALAYLTGQDAAVTKGLTTEAAQRAGIEMARNVLMDYSSITPIEAQVIKAAIPFYGFMSHLMRYTLRYPFDHPVRAEIMASFARQELARQGDSLPESFLSSFIFGKGDKSGRKLALNIGSLTPFTDLGNLFSLAGIASSLNPVFSTVLDQLGVDRGRPELYPTLRYDTQTGKMVATQEDPFTNFIHNLIPQTELISALSGTSNMFKRELANDPRQAYLGLINQLGLPLIVKSINPMRIQFNAELQREQAQQNALKAALRSGDYSQAGRFPALAPLLKQVSDLQASGQLSAFDPSQHPIPSVNVTSGGI